MLTVCMNVFTKLKCVSLNYPANKLSKVVLVWGNILFKIIKYVEPV